MRLFKCEFIETCDLYRKDKSCKGKFTKKRCEIRRKLLSENISSFEEYINLRNYLIDKEKIDKTTELLAELEEFERKLEKEFPMPEIIFEDMDDSEIQKDINQEYINQELKRDEKK